MRSDIMLQPSIIVASIVRQTGLEQFADAITIDRPRECNLQANTPARCHDMATAYAREQLLADVAAIGFALFAAAVVGRIAVTFVGLFGTCLKYHRARAQVRAAASQRTSRGGLLDG
jgi:hypothetical protein